MTAMYLVERVLPHVPYRQWTLSFPHRVRWVLLKDAELLSDVLSVFLRALLPCSADGHVKRAPWCRHTRPVDRWFDRALNATTLSDVLDGLAQ